MADLQEYDVEVNGVKTTLLLSDADAKKRGLSKPKPKAAEAKADSKTAKSDSK